MFRLALVVLALVVMSGCSGTPTSPDAVVAPPPAVAGPVFVRNQVFALDPATPPRSSPGFVIEVPGYTSGILQVSTQIIEPDEYQLTAAVVDVATDYSSMSVVGQTYPFSIRGVARIELELPNRPGNFGVWVRTSSSPVSLHGSTTVYYVASR